jgi:hypothetical protein
LALVVKDQRDRRALLDLASKWLEMAGDDPKTLKLIAQVERLKGPAHRKRLFDRTAIGDLTSFVAGQQRCQAASLSAER